MAVSHQHRLKAMMSSLIYNSTTSSVILWHSRLDDYENRLAFNSSRVVRVVLVTNAFGNRTTVQNSRCNPRISYRYFTCCPTSCFVFRDHPASFDSHGILLRCKKNKFRVQFFSQFWGRKNPPLPTCGQSTVTLFDNLLHAQVQSLIAPVPSLFSLSRSHS